jgi:sulfur carrier protein
MHVQFNGETILLSQSPTLGELLLQQCAIGEGTPGIAVAVNGQIIFRSDWTSTEIKEGDQIEVVHAMQGG